jgi:PAS domain S-box-containing protein
VPGTHFDSEQRLSLILGTQQAIAAAGDDLESVMQIVAERSMAILGADGSMVNLVDGDMLHTRAAGGTATQVRDARRPIAKSIARYAIKSGEPLLVEDTRTDPRINQEMRGKVGDTSLICVPLFSGSDVIGTLNVMSNSETERLNEEDRQTLEMLSVVLSAGVSRVAEFDARRAHAQAIARFRTLFDSASLGILRLDAGGVAVEVNPALEQMLGASAEELIGSRFSAHLIAEHRQTVDELLAETVAGRRESFVLEARCTTKSGGALWAHVRAVAEQHEDGAPMRVVAMIENITERKHAEQELIRQSELNEHQALHDPLTGLPNRLLFG